MYRTAFLFLLVFIAVVCRSGDTNNQRRLEEEKEHYQALLKEITERQTTLDVLNYIDKLESEEEIDAQKISSELGYKEETVQEVLKKSLKER